MKPQSRISIGYPSVGIEEADAAHAVIMSGLLTQGKKVQEAEEKFAEYTKVPHAVAVGNGTLALELALRAHKVGRGDEVITTPFTFFATAASIINSGATPVFVDIDEKTYNIDINQIEAAITERTAAIMPVHLYGRICDMDAINAIADKYKLAVIEDAAQAAGSWYKNRHAGSFGTGSFSFYGSKNITSGEGGIVTTSDAAFADRLRKLRNHGSAAQYIHDEASSNYRMTDIQGAILGVQLGRLEKITLQRQQNAALYDSLLSNSAVITPIQNDSTYQSCYHQYTVRVPGDRAAVQSYMNDHNIDVRPFYPLPLHRQPALNLTDVEMPVAEKASREVLSLPVHPNLSDREIEQVATSLLEAIQQ